MAYKYWIPTILLLPSIVAYILRSSNYFTFKPVRTKKLK